MARSFTIFTNVFSKLEPKAFLNALEFHAKMLQNSPQLSEQPDTISISCFRQFMRMIKLGEPMTCMMPLPKEHVEFYRAMVVRLIQANELPETATNEFDRIFPFPSSS
jgi:hypothetical protein